MGKKLKDSDYISFLDIVPGKLYLAHAQEGQRRPCTVVCDDTHGWQRGWVKKMDEVHRYGQHAVGITVKFLEPKYGSRDFYCVRIGEEYRFKSWFGAGETVLWHLPDDWFDREITKLASLRDDLQSQIDVLAAFKGKI